MKLRLLLSNDFNDPEPCCGTCQATNLVVKSHTEYHKQRAEVVLDDQIPR